MDGRNMLKKLFIVCTLVAQNLSFAGELPAKETHVEYAPDRFVGTSYETRVVEAHTTDSAWQVELLRVEPTKPKETHKRFLGWVGDIGSSFLPLTEEERRAADERVRVYYMLRVRCLPAVCNEYRPKSVDISFRYFESGYTPRRKFLKNVDLGTYAYFYEDSTTLSIVPVSLLDLRIEINEFSNQSKFPSLAIAK